jgi:hypothetical protein
MKWIYAWYTWTRFSQNFQSWLFKFLLRCWQRFWIKWWKFALNLITNAILICYFHALWAKTAENTDIIVTCKLHPSVCWWPNQYHAVCTCSLEGYEVEHLSECSPKCLKVLVSEKHKHTPKVWKKKQKVEDNLYCMICSNRFPNCSSLFRKLASGNV